MRILGWLAMALGVIGIVASIALAAGVWVIKPDIQARADELLAAVDDGLTRATTLTGTVTAELADASARVGEVKARADELVAAPVVDPAAAASVSTSISEFVRGPYSTLRGEYVALRERVSTVGESLRALDAAIPAIELPGTLSARLQQIDERLVEIDSTIVALSEAGIQVLAEPGIAGRVSERAGSAEEILQAAGELVTDVEGRLDQARDRLASAGDRIGTLLTAGAGIGALAGLYLAGLHVLLFQQGRRWSRREPAPPG
jgi:hypothetical protein